jgi:hypothetical protein
MSATQHHSHSTDTLQSIQLLTAAEVAKALRVAPISVIRNFPSVRVGRRRLFRLSDVLAVTEVKK